MRRRSNLLILFGILFFFVGAAVVFVVIGDDDEGGGGAAPGEQLREVVVPVVDLAAGADGDTVISDGNVKVENRPISQVPANAITSALSLQGQSFLQAVGEGQIITTSMLVQQSLSQRLEIPEGYEAVAVTLDFDAGVAQYVAPGDRLNLYSVLPKVDCKDADTTVNCPVATPRVELLLTNVLVLDTSAQAGTTLDQQATTATTIAGDNRTRSVSGGSIVFLLAMRSTDAERAIYHNTGSGSLYATLVRDDAPPARDTTGADIGTIYEGVPTDDNAAPIPTTTTSTTAPEDSEG